MTTIDTTSGDYDYTYLSLGAGVQSSALLVLACTDERVPKPDVAIFADTGDEPDYVYSYLKRLAEWAKPYDVDVVTATAGVLSESIFADQKNGKSFVKIPVYTRGAGKGMFARRCTADFKIIPVTKKVRELLGYKPRQRVKEKVRCMLGISLDEIERMKESRFGFVTNTFPLVDLGIKRDGCLKICAEAGLPEPEKSACVYCPYHSDTHWQWMKDKHPDEFAKAVAFDEKIRHYGMGGELPLFVHRSCLPLSEVALDVTDPDQVNLFTNECEGMCGV
jgi:hypothetical protein